MKKNTFKYLLFCAFLTLLTACGSSDGDDEISPLSSQKLITNFMISDVSGVVNNTSNEVMATILGPDQDITSVTPIITVSPGATISPASGVVQDFTNPVTYTVTAEDGSTVDYTITVIGTIFSFTFDGKSYEIISEQLNWRDAADFAIERGGILAEINSVEENNAIFLVLNNTPGMDFSPSGRQAVWLGGNDFDNEGTWVLDGNNDGNGIQFWNGEADGMSVGGLYNNWNDTEPDNLALSGGQNALSMALADPALPEIIPGRWCDVGEDSELFFVIEFN
ncbi:DUF5018 domain-containing protein [Flavobacteriaceae bacterium R38]|nr:DUF5018 domain-containing protein [Flavobacteriaceae bacterium R38]